MVVYRKCFDRVVRYLCKRFLLYHKSLLLFSFISILVFGSHHRIMDTSPQSKAHKRKYSKVAELNNNNNNVESIHRAKKYGNQESKLHKLPFWLCCIFLKFDELNVFALVMYISLSVSPSFSPSGSHFLAALCSRLSFNRCRCRLRPCFAFS